LDYPEKSFKDTSHLLGLVQVLQTEAHVGIVRNGQGTVVPHQHVDDGETKLTRGNVASVLA
jgi:hypothetical protein